MVAKDPIVDVVGGRDGQECLRDVSTGGPVGMYSRAGTIDPASQLSETPRSGGQGGNLPGQN